jgi:DNA-binding NtrC family response regulator
VELADGGTAFFDEIGDLPLEMQVKLLRLVQEREYRPVGALKWRSADLRIIAATHRDLQAEVSAGRFRQDLYYRLNVVVIHLPPLRERKEDIPDLVEHFLGLAEAAGLPPLGLSPAATAALKSYDWPGNVRELKHAIDRMAALRSEGALQMADLPSALQNHMASSTLTRLSNALDDTPAEVFRMAPAAPVIPLPETERMAITQALAATRGEKGKAARLLNIGRTTLYRKIREYGL